MCRTRLVAVVLWVAQATFVTGQAEVWLIRRSILPRPIELRVASADVPYPPSTLASFGPGSCVGPVAASPDGKTFFLVNDSRLLRFDTATRMQLPAITSPVGCWEYQPMAVSPDNNWWIFAGPRYLIVHATTQQLVVDEPGGWHGVTFIPGGTMRAETQQHELRVVEQPYSTSALWSKTLAPEGVSVFGLAANASTVYAVVRIDSEAAQPTELRAYSVLDGREQARTRLTPFNLTLAWVAAPGNRLYVATDSPTGLVVSRLDPASLALMATGTLNEPGFGDRLSVPQIDVSPDGTLLTVVHVRHHTHGAQRIVRFAAFDPDSLQHFFNTFALDTEASAELVRFGSAPSAPTLRVIDLGHGRFSINWDPGMGPGALSYGIRLARVGESGPVIAVVAGGVRSWQSPLLAPGTYRIEVMAINSAGSASSGVTAMLAPAAPPAAPALRLIDLGDRRFSVNWEPGVGPPAESYEIRLARTGEPLALVATLTSEVRSWQSPVLTAGTYSIEVTAINSAGSASVRTDAVLARASVPFAPTTFKATTVDDVTRLTWQADPNGAVPEGFIIEAAPAPLTSFFEVARVAAPELMATRLPTGIWQARVKAFANSAISGPSNVDVVAAKPCSFAPSEPSGLTYDLHGSSVTLRWTFPAHGSAEQYVIDVGSMSGATNLARLATASPYPWFQAVAPPGAYFVRVRGQNACGVSVPSNEIVVLVQ